MRIVFEKIQQVVRADARRLNSLSRQIFSNGDACRAPCTNPRLTFIPAPTCLFCLLKLGLQLRFPIHKKHYTFSSIMKYSSLLRSRSTGQQMPPSVSANGLVMTNDKSGARNEAFDRTNQCSMDRIKSCNPC